MVLEPQARTPRQVQVKPTLCYEVARQALVALDIPVPVVLGAAANLAALRLTGQAQEAEDILEQVVPGAPAGTVVVEEVGFE